MKSLTLILFASLLSFSLHAVVGPISGDTSVCVGASGLLVDTTLGGIWISSDTSVVSIDSISGNIWGISAGTSIITYVIGSISVTKIITVNPLPPPIRGNTSLCLGESTILKDSTGCCWNYMYTAVDLDNDTDTSVRVTGVVIGYDVVSYTNFFGCSVSVWIFVNSMPPITGITTVLNIDSTVTLSNPRIGGRWSSSNNAIATVDSITGIVKGISPGMVTIYYKKECTASTNIVVWSPNSAQNLIKENKNEVVIYPNPTQNEIAINFSNAISVITIFNLLGQAVYKHECNSEKVVLNVAHLPVGVYFIKINGSLAGKFAKK